MKKTKVENISNINLDFFLRQNSEDIRVNLAPGEISWCDSDSSTRSMILYERKNLIKTSEWLFGLAGLFSDLITVEPIGQPTGTIFFLEPTQTSSHTEDLTTSLSKDISENTNAQTHTEDLTTSLSNTIEPKTYKGKKRGRKKKRGPKKGSKKNKPITETTTDTDK